MSRQLASGSSPVVEQELGVRYELGATLPWLRAFGGQLNAYESPRAPPLRSPDFLS